jgi:hypothetical protein
MKSKITLPFLLLFFNQLVAQEVITTEVQDSFKTPQYEVVYDDVFLSKKETKSLFKVDFLPILNALNEFVPGKRGLGLEFEHKIGKHFSLNSGLFAGIGLLERNSDKPLSLIIEPRWYFSQKANNLNGEYISLKTEITKEFSENIKGTYSNTSLNVGLQRRVYNNWFANFHVGLNYFHSDNDKVTYKFNKTLSLIGDFTMGLSFGGGKKSTIQSCDVFNCFEEEKSLFKVDLRGLLIGVSQYGFTSQPIIAYEHKLNTSWSLNHEVRSKLNVVFKQDPFGFNNYNNNFVITYNIEPRYYYNMKKRIAEGKSSNNLSGNYFSLSTGYTYRRIKYEQIGDPKFINKRKEERHYITFLPKYGIQRKIFNKGFVDISFAPFQFYNFKSNLENEYSLSSGEIRKNQSQTDWSFEFAVDIQPVVDIKIGLAF